MIETSWLIAGGGVVIVLIAALIILTIRKRNSERLKSRFGQEYSRAVEASGNQKEAEAELRDRQKRVEGYDIKPLEAADQARYVEAWRAVQSQFVDDPNQAVTEADKLLAEVMTARGYLVGDFEQRSADLSVDHSAVVTNYRTGHDIAVRHAKGEASTEDLRQAMVAYRSLFDELVGQSEPAPTEAATKAEAPAPTEPAPAETAAKVEAEAPAETEHAQPVAEPAAAEGR
jgi:hypothetical protein